MTMTLTTAAAKPAQPPAAGLLPNANPAANPASKQIDQAAPDGALPAQADEAAATLAPLFAQLLNLANQVELAPAAAGDDGDDAVTADAGATPDQAATTGTAAAADQTAALSAMAAPMLNLAMAMALPFAPTANAQTGNAGSATVQAQPRVDGMSALLASGSNISLNLNIANQQPGAAPAPDSAVTAAPIPAAATTGAATSTAAAGDAAATAATTAPAAAPAAPLPTAPNAAGAAQALAAALPVNNPAPAPRAGKDAERAPASGNFASATAAAGSTVQDDGGGSGLRLSAAPASNGVNGAYTPAAPAAAPLADSVKLAGTPEQWQQPLREALGDRLQLQLQRNNDHAVIRLEPPNMGRIEISIRHSAGALQINLSASNSEVLRQLNNIGDSVRQDLSQRSFTEVAVNVSASPRGQAMADSDGRGGRQGQQDQARAPGRALSDDEAAAATFAMLTEQE
ncbi:flagellar hook-length control protein FliK [Rugamonas sp. CCM 8940]|uniref:flagellar hook-length control protein FliK n=1 Tax=Rugamonas sp. CCM 8940 TaxID=2765359 RepID=UPI0018F708C0|nr:flagellar hook-length control protein FliK [Rugamonas sp. CCM 8940]MBJ7310690.1 flagellar hook-length control protein FliK [Rugamonas sp. CCM 8940]